MTFEDFSRIESTLQVELPTWYVERLRTHPLSNAYEELFETADALIEENRCLRAEGFFAAPWPSSFLVIGKDAAGDPVFILPGSSDERIYKANHEIDEFPPHPDHLKEMAFWDTLEDYISETQTMLNEVDDEFEQRREKKWWQFWR